MKKAPPIDNPLLDRLVTAFGCMLAAAAMKGDAGLEFCRQEMEYMHTRLEERFKMEGWLND